MAKASGADWKRHIAYAEGTANPSLYNVCIPETIDVKAIRTKIGMAHEEFAKPQHTRLPLRR